MAGVERYLLSGFRHRTRQTLDGMDDLDDLRREVVGGVQLGSSGSSG